MLCLACASIGYPICEPCSRGLQPAAPRAIDRITVHAAFVHTAAAARLVHNLKYRMSHRAGRFLADAMAARVPEGFEALIPVPRVWWRRVSHGIDQTSVLAGYISDMTGIPVVNALGAPLWHPRLAGQAREDRNAAPFTLRRTPKGPALLVDDVCTTGSTIQSAARCLGSSDVLGALVATSAFDLNRG